MDVNAERPFTTSFTSARGRHNADPSGRWRCSWSSRGKGLDFKSEQAGPATLVEFRISNSEVSASLARPPPYWIPNLNGPLPSWPSCPTITRTCAHWSTTQGKVDDFQRLTLFPVGHQPNTAQAFDLAALLKSEETIGHHCKLFLAEQAGDVSALLSRR